MSTAEQPDLGGPHSREPAPGDDPRWPVQATAPAGAPNVLVIMTDDVGYGASSTFGGPIPTPTLDSLADRGLRYTRFHTTAMCSPTRAALMTGRNHHQVGSGRVTEMAVAYDGYTSVIPDSASTVAETLRGSGYSTAHFGKYHNVPDFETGPSGPFDHWPTSMGFQHFYGYLGGSTDNYAPALFQGTRAIEPPTDDPTYHLERDLADQAIGWIREQKSVAPGKPLFIQYANAACHAPHHAPAEEIAKHAGQFDQGWDVLREQTLERQKLLGVVPESTELTDRPEQIAAWDSLSDDHKRVAARMMEVYAAALSYADAQVGRVLAELERIGELDNTLVFYIQGDNGASPEGGPNGSLNEITYVNRMEDSVERLLEHLDELGGPLHYNHFPNGWAFATDSPFQWYKMVASHFGGTRNGLVISHPARIARHGEIRGQFHHVIDIAPTILDIVGIGAPDVVAGVPQIPMSGVPMTYTFEGPDLPSTRTTQYFELMGNVAIYQDGWMAATTPTEMPWEFATDVRTVENATWELYHVEEDFSQATDLAQHHPGKLKELIGQFWIEAAANNVLPILAGKSNRPGPPKPNPTLGVSSFTYHGAVTRVPPGASPDITNRTYAITAEVAVPSDGGHGLLLSQGGRFGGHSLYVLDGVLTYHYNLLGRERFTIAADSPLAPGARTVSARFEAETADRGSGGTLTLICDGREIGRGAIARTAPWRLNYIEGLNVGRDTGTPVAEDYRPPFAFTGRLNSVTMTLDPTTQKG